MRLVYQSVAPEVRHGQGGEETGVCPRFGPRFGPVWSPVCCFGVDSDGEREKTAKNEMVGYFDFSVAE